MLVSVNDITAENGLERAVLTDPRFTTGLTWGKPRPGHPEGAVVFHIVEVLKNVDRLVEHPSDRRTLRFVALVHDTFKYQVDRSRERIGDNHHGWLAAKFASDYIWDNAILTLIETHDEAFLSWKKGNTTGRWDKAYERASRLITRLHDTQECLIDDYLAFFRADNETGDKQPECVEWFSAVASGMWTP